MLKIEVNFEPNIEHPKNKIYVIKLVPVPRKILLT